MTPAEVVEGVLRTRGDDGPYAVARRVIAALRGHQMLADDTTATPAAATAARRTTKTTQPPQRCANPADPHSGTALVGGTCPICHWRTT